MVLKKNIIYLPPCEVVAAGTNRNLMQAALKEPTVLSLDKTTSEEITDTLFAFGQGKNVFRSKNLMQAETFSKSKRNIKQAATEDNRFYSVFVHSWILESSEMAQELVSRSKYVRVQNYGDSLAIAVAKPFSQELQIEKGSTVRTWVQNGIFHAERAKE